MFYFIIIIILFITILVRFRHTKIEWNTFFKKGVKPLNEGFGIFCWHGKQGSSKTTSAIKFISQNLKGRTLYSNMKSLNLPVDYYYFSGMNELIKIGNVKNAIIYFDELFSILSRDTKLSKDFILFISQMRKNNILLVTTCQEWLELPPSLRRYVKVGIECKKITCFGLFNVMFNHIYDTTNIKWSQEENDYISPLIETHIYKGYKKLFQLFDTTEVISNAEIPPQLISEVRGGTTTPPKECIVNCEKKGV